MEPLGPKAGGGLISKLIVLIKKSAALQLAIKNRHLQFAIKNRPFQVAFTIPK
jgi:hypothetical protein